MDGRGRALDNIFVERLWRNVKHEDVYLKGYANMAELMIGLAQYFSFYNEERPHQSLGYKRRMPSMPAARAAGQRLLINSAVRGENPLLRYAAQGILPAHNQGSAVPLQVKKWMQL